VNWAVVSFVVLQSSQYALGMKSRQGCMRKGK
jgi:hypothetical protein